MRKKIIMNFVTLCWIVTIFCAILYKSLDKFDTLKPIILKIIFLPAIIVFLHLLVILFSHEVAHVIKTHVRILNHDEIEKTLIQIEKTNQVILKIRFLFATFLLSLAFIIFMNSSGLDDIDTPLNTFFAILTYGIFFVSLLGLFVILYQVNKVRALKTDLKNGITKIEGKVFITNNTNIPSLADLFSNSYDHSKLLRIGHYAFRVDENNIENVKEGNMYEIQFTDGTKQLIKYSEITT